MEKHHTNETIKSNSRMMLKNSSSGSVSMEYIIVSCFALLVSVTAVTWLGKIVKARITSIAERLSLDTSDLDLNMDDAFDLAD